MTATAPPPRSAPPLALGRIEHQAPGGTWSDSRRVCERLREWTKRFGRPPFGYEWASVETTGCVCGGWRVWRDEHPYWPCSNVVVRHFGSWRAGLEAAGLEPLRTYPRGTPQERYPRVLALHAEGLSKAEIARQVGVDPKTVSNYLHASQRCSACGGPVILGKRGLCRSCSQRQRVIRWTRGQIVAAARDWAAEHTKPPTADEWREGNAAWERAYPRWPSQGTAARQFGSWIALLEAAGLPHSPPKQRPSAWNGETITAALRADAASRGCPPTSFDWKRATAAHPNATTTARCFGTWPAALRAAGLADAARTSPS